MDCGDRWMFRESRRVAAATENEQINRRTYVTHRNTHLYWTCLWSLTGRSFGNHAATNGHQTHPSATSPTAPAGTKSVKLVLRPKATPKTSLNEQNAPITPAQPSTPLDALLRELPPKDAFEDQIPLADVIDRLVQDSYSKLVELSETYALFLRLPTDCTPSRQLIFTVCS